MLLAEDNRTGRGNESKESAGIRGWEYSGVCRNGKKDMRRVHAMQEQN